MNDDPVQLLVVAFAVFFGIGAHGIERDHDVAVDRGALIVVEGDDVRVIVVSEILSVAGLYLLVTDEHIAHLAYLPAVLGGHSAYPGRGCPSLDVRHFHAVCMVCYH